MTKVILKNTEALRDLLFDICQQIGWSGKQKKTRGDLYDQAFSEEEEKPWEPQYNEAIYLVMLAENNTKGHRWIDSDWQREALKNGIVHRTEASAQQFLEDYKTFLKDRSNKR